MSINIKLCLQRLQFRHAFEELEEVREFPDTGFECGMRFIIVSTFITISACGGRTVHTVETQQSLDTHLSCTHLLAEFENNTKRLEELALEKNHVDGNNARVIFSGPTAIDVSDAQEKEAESISNRNDRLKSIMSDKNCR